MSQEAKEAILDITDWYSSLRGTFIRIFGGEKTLHILPRYATENLVTQEVSYHISIGISVALHWRKMAPWPTLPLWIVLYDIKNSKDVDVVAKETIKL